MEHQNKFFEFIEMTHNLRKVERMCHYTNTDRLENDMEHGYQLTLLCRLVMDYLKLPLDKNKVLKYALAHDIIEVYAGDTNPFDPSAVMDKEKRELASLKQLKTQFPGTDMRDYIDQYHQKSDDEAKFVYALDKFIPEYNIHLTDGKTFKQFNIDRDTLARHIRKAYIYPPLQPFADDFIERIYQHDEWFNTIT